MDYSSGEYDPELKPKQLNDNKYFNEDEALWHYFYNIDILNNIYYINIYIHQKAISSFHYDTTPISFCPP